MTYITRFFKAIARYFTESPWVGSDAQVWFSDIRAMTERAARDIACDGRHWLVTGADGRCDIKHCTLDSSVANDAALEDAIPLFPASINLAMYLREIHPKLVLQLLDRIEELDGR